MNYPLLIAAGLALIGIGLYNWRYGVFTALVLVVLEGAIRKWVLPQASQLIYFGKDIVLLATYVRFFFWGERGATASQSFSQWGETVRLLLIASAVWIFGESFNPATGSIIAGLFGARSYLIYVPLCFMIPALFKSADELERFLRFYLVLALPVGILGMAQFNAPPESPLNVYAAGATGSADSSEVATFGEDNLVRVTGTFSYISGYSTYLVFVLALLLPLLASVRSNFWRVILGGTVAVMVGNMGMTGSRSTVLGAGIVLIGFVVLTTMTGSEGERSRSIIHLIAGAAGIAAIRVFYRAAFMALQQRVDYDWEENQTRLLAAIWEPWNFLGLAGVWGQGAGTTQPAVGALRTVLHLPAAGIDFSSPTDSENSRVLVELGLPGFLLWYGLRIALVVALWRTRRQLKSPFLRQIGLGAFLVLLFQLFSVTVFGPTSNCFHWFLVGFIGLLPKLDARTQTAPAPAFSRAGKERFRRPVRRRAALGPAANSQTQPARR